MLEIESIQPTTLNQKSKSKRPIYIAAGAGIICAIVVAIALGIYFGNSAKSSKPTDVSTTPTVVSSSTGPNLARLSMV